MATPKSFPEFKPDPKRGPAQREVELGQVRFFRIDYGFLSADVDGREDIRFYSDDIANQYWHPTEGNAITFVRYNQRNGTVARQVASLYHCTDPKIIAYCGASVLPHLWKPVLPKYVRSLRPEEQYSWIINRQRYLDQDTDLLGWWKYVKPDVLLTPAILTLLPKKIAAAAIRSALVGVGKLKPEIQGSSGFLVAQGARAKACFER